MITWRRVWSPFRFVFFRPFFWSSWYALKEDRQSRKWAVALLKMYLAYAVRVILMNNALLYLYITVLGMSLYTAPVLSLIVCVPLDFIMNKYRPFR